MKNDGLFKIGDMARMFHVSVSILRYYEKVGLLSPEYTDSETGYRYYSTRQFETLYTIKYLRKLGLPLAEIASFVNNRNLDDIRSLLELQRAQVRERILELAAIERQIENRLHQMNRAGNAVTDVVAVELMPARRLAVLNREIVPENSGEMEIAISELEGRSDSTAVFLGKIGVGVSEERLRRRLFRPCDFLFMVLEDDDAYDGEVLCMPETLSVTIQFIGGHEKAGPSYRKLFEYLDLKRPELCGPALETTMVDYGLTSNTSEFLTEIQLPIK